jgi:metal-sulfur cluster biosynthetic enzyme
MPPSDPARVAEVRAALTAVLDPELDESVVDLGFVTGIVVDGDSVTVEFRLPTFWCSANFAWIMAEDMHAAVRGLSWVRQADIRLVDHFAAAKVNAGIAEGEGFRAAFGGEAAADLGDLRQTFRGKAYLGRMSRLIEALRALGWNDRRILAATIADLRALPNPELAPLASRYLELRLVYGGSSGSSDPAFRKADGETIASEDMTAFLRDIRMTRRGVEANGEMCRVLLKARIEAPAPPA